ncbi:MAG: hypothetical protein ALECFALPRED_009900 [Alectoria fallacina]|uniref:DUF7918 domain-containing protein n=1 Tax=Alectoria fallacina TaxID=1903189 RepID=A0A8H3IBV4_9LECA|nr:MAG: hypothetical protein ALECFALPRED_009900 [Alectoria fallacina]
MPCFKGLAVSIHTPQGPLPEYSIQKQSRFSRISSYIPVPPAKVPQNSTSNQPEQSTFAISITLLTPGLNVPYSQPKPTPENPYPRPRIVSGLPSITGDRGRYGSVIGPYIPLTTSPNETIAAYIYFDGRAKEEVATLLRRGEETWVNSRWVGVPESEGGGLAEREFLFREVGLERWLNGLDLEGKDAAAKIERRRQKMEKKRRRRKLKTESDDEAESSLLGGKEHSEKRVLRYGADNQSPLEQMSDSDEMFGSGSGSDSDDDPVPESTGQIKVALFRVLASGEIKRGEYSPQFDAHDDDDEMGRGTENGTKTDGNNTEEVDHTTSFAQPKSLDPKSISTQTVTGIDPPDRPFAVFTFLYRGEKQLQKMGILPSSPKISDKLAVSNGKRRSMQADFAKLKPLNPNGLMGFSKFRDPNERFETNGVKDKASKKRSNDEDSDEDVEIRKEVLIKTQGDDIQEANGMLSPEDARRQGELAEGVQKIRLKRQHSADQMDLPSPAPAHRKSPPSTTPTAGSTPPYQQDVGNSPTTVLPSTVYDGGSSNAPEDAMIGSPLKRQRASVSGLDEEAMRSKFGLGLLGASGDVLGAIEQDKNNAGPAAEDKPGFGDILGLSTQEKVIFGGRLGSQAGDESVKMEEMEEEL